MHGALKGLRRVETIIFPLLTLDTTTLPPPDLATNPKLKMILKVISKLLEQCMRGCKQKLFFFNTFMNIFEKKTDTIILELKKKSFALANEGSDSEL